MKLAIFATIALLAGAVILAETDNPIVPCTFERVHKTDTGQKFIRPHGTDILVEVPQDVTERQARAACFKVNGGHLF